jgi:hypothetical protein
LRNKWIRVLEKNMRQLFSFICIIIIILYSCRLGLINYNLMKQVLRGNAKRTWGTTIVLHGVTSLHFFNFLKISIYHIQTIPNTWSLKKNPGILVSANWWKKETIFKINNPQSNQNSLDVKELYIYIFQFIQCTFLIIF